LQFPKDLEKYVNAKPKTPLKDYLTNEEYNPEVKDFFGLGYDGEEYHLHGQLHALPPQQGIPGFQRVTMVKFIRDSEGEFKLFAYEGLVTPGNTFMVGRWWDLFGRRLRDRQPYCGPFIFWNIECDEEEDNAMNIGTALEYFRNIEEEP
jgi:hypothetical protein